MSTAARWRAGRLLAGAVFTVAFAYAVDGSLHTNAVRLPLNRAARVEIVLPQGWGFFTRDAREVRSFVYQQRPDGTWRPVFGEANTGTGFGHFDRGNRAAMLDGALIVSATANSEAYVECRSTELAACLKEATSRAKAGVVEATRDYPVCGRVAVVRQRPTPWAWAASDRATTMPRSVSVVEVRCVD